MWAASVEASFEKASHCKAFSDTLHGLAEPGKADLAGCLR